jgi:hypothetical protein
VSGKVSPNSHSTGISTRQVTVSSITPDGTTALCVDKTGVEVRVPMLWQRAKGILPEVGETWILSQDLGQWSFAMIVATSATPFATLAGGNVTAPGSVSGASVSATGLVSGAQGSFSGSQAGAAILSIKNTHAAPTAPAVQIDSQAAADQALGIMVTGDADERFAVDSNGQHSWGPGNAAADVTLARSAAAVAKLTGSFQLTGSLYHDASWTLVIGLFQNSWSGTFNYRLIAANLLAVAFSLTPGTVTDTTPVLTGLPAPASNKHLSVTTDALKVSPVSGTSFESPRLRFNSDGSVWCFGISTASTFVDGGGFIFLDV